MRLHVGKKRAARAFSHSLRTPRSLDFFRESGEEGLHFRI